MWYNWNVHFRFWILLHLLRQSLCSWTTVYNYGWFCCEYGTRMQMWQCSVLGIDRYDLLFDCGRWVVSQIGCRFVWVSAAGEW